MFSARDGFARSIFPSAVRRDQRLAHPAGEAAQAAQPQGWVKGHHDREPQRGDTDAGLHEFLLVYPSPER
jgi:hypothetical protein